MTKLSEYLHSAEAAEYLGVHHDTNRNWAARGEIPMHRNPVNRYRLFKKTDLDKLLKKHPNRSNQDNLHSVHEVKPLDGPSNAQQNHILHLGYRWRYDHAAFPRGNSEGNELTRLLWLRRTKTKKGVQDPFPD